MRDLLHATPSKCDARTIAFRGEEQLQNAAHCGLVAGRLNLLTIGGDENFLTLLKGRPNYPDSAPLPTAMMPLRMGLPDSLPE